MFDKFKSKLLKYALVIGGLFTGTSLSSCVDANKTEVDNNKGLHDLQIRNPSADTLHTDWNDSIDLFKEYAERYTDTTKIQNIKEKYKQQLSQYEHNLDSLIKMQNQINSKLFKSASNGDTLGVKQALEQGADINAQDVKSGKTALMIAVSRSAQHRYYETADYLLGEPGIHTDIKDRNGFSAREYVSVLAVNGSKDWLDILRKFDEPTTEERVRGNTEVERFALLVEKEYNKLMDTYGKEMCSALGYVYEGLSHYNFIIGLSARTEGREILINEDGSTDTLQVDPRQMHPYNLAKLKLQKPHLIDRTSETVGKPSVIYTEEHKRHNNRYLQRFKVTSEITTTRDGKQNKKVVSRSRI